MIRNKNILDLSEYEAEIELKILAKELKDADKDDSYTNLRAHET